MHKLTTHFDETILRNPEDYCSHMKKNKDCMIHHPSVGICEDCKIKKYKWLIWRDKEHQIILFVCDDCLRSTDELVHGTFK